MENEQRYLSTVFLLLLVSGVIVPQQNISLDEESPFDLDENTPFDEEEIANNQSSISIASGINHLFLQSEEENASGYYYDVMIKYIVKLFCTCASYRFNHIYVERSVSTELSDEMIKQINGCTEAGSLVSRYDFNGSEDFKIHHPTASSGMVIGIHLYNLNIVQNLDHLNLSWIDTKLPQKPEIKNIILCEEEIFDPDESKLQEIFSEMWRKQELNAIIVYWNDQRLNAVSYTPFPKMRLIFIPEQDLNNVEKLFWNKARDLYGQPFKVTGFYDESRARFDRKNFNNLTALDGLDGLLSRLIVEKLNAALDLSVPADGQEIGELLPNKTATGCLGALINGNMDMGLNVRFYRLNHFEGRVEATHTNGRDDICFLVPKKGKAIDIFNLFRPFFLSTWAAIFGMFPIYAYFFYLAIKNQSNKRSFRYHSFQFFAYTLQQGVTFIPAMSRQKILIIIWVFCVMQFSYTYSGKLSGSLIIPKDRPNIETIEELAKSELNVISFPRYNRQIREFFSDPKYNGLYNPLFGKLQNSSILEFYDAVGKFDQSLGFANKFHINMYLRRVYVQDSAIFFHHVQQCAVPFLAVYGVRYGTPYKNRINFIIRQAQECGLIDKWERNNAVSDQFSQARLGGGSELVPFSIIHLQTSFYLLMIGCIISTIAFIGEKMYVCRKQKKKKLINIVE